VRAARPLSVALSVGALLALAEHASAREIGQDGETGASLRTSLKSAAIVQGAPDASAPSSEGEAGASTWRLRLDAEARPGTSFSLAAAYEQRLQIGSATVAGTGPIPLDTRAPYRLRQLDWRIAGRDAFAWRHEVDRASVAIHLPRAEITLGRQAVGWGRGALFGAVDLFAPFSPLEPDREWRRGVDAIRADVRLASRLSADVVAALGESARESALATRVRGYVGDLDGEVVAGWRARDLVAGATTSAAVGDAELHGELCLFLAPDDLPSGGAWGNGRLAPKGVLGGSYRIPVGRGVVVLAEYHYSGFGARSARDVLPLLGDAAFRDRFARGDTQILGRHAVAVLGSLELTNELAVQALALASPVDGSGVLSPAATYTLSDAASVNATLYAPWGAGSDALWLRSEYGATPLSFFVQVRLYD
jgi:hypothetical protein